MEIPVSRECVYDNNGHLHHETSPCWEGAMVVGEVWNEQVKYVLHVFKVESSDSKL